MATLANISESKRISQVTGIEQGRVQFLEKSFAEWLGFAGRGTGVEALEEDSLALLRWLHELVFDQGRSIDWVRNELLVANGGMRFIALSSGKGGVGKTTCSVNLAFAIAELGFRVLLVDADMGLGNVHVFAGVNPTTTIQDFVDHHLSLEEALCPVTDNLWMLCGGSGGTRLANLDARRMNRLLRHLRALHDSFEIVLIDTGAGLSQQVLNFLLQAQEIVVVTTPNIAATLDAYSLIKTTHEEGMNGRVRLLINQCASEADAEAAAAKIADCARQFLDFSPETLGFLTRDAGIEQSNQERRPFIHDPAPGANVERLLVMARELTRGLRPTAPETTSQPFVRVLESASTPVLA